jgi:hypothetical protein
MIRASGQVQGKEWACGEQSIHQGDRWDFRALAGPASLGASKPRHAGRSCTNRSNSGALAEIPAIKPFR